MCRQNIGGTDTTADVEGEFQIGPFMRDSEIWISAWHEEKGSSPVTKVDAGTWDVELVLGGMVHVTGTVVDASTGNPLDKLTLHAIGEDRSRDHVLDGSNGRISVMVDPRTWGLVVDSKDHVVHFDLGLDLQSVNAYHLGTIALDPGKQLSGRVYDSASGEPVEGATVALVGYHRASVRDAMTINFVPSFLGRTVRTTTTANGEFVLKPLPFVTSRISVFAWGYQSEELQVGETFTVLDIPLDVDRGIDSFARIQGTIETLSGELVGGNVAVRNTDGSGSTRSGHDDGRFNLHLKAGTYNIFAVTDLGKSDTVTITVDEAETLEVRLIVDPKGRLVGHILGLRDDELATVSVHFDHTEIGRIEGVENGEFSIEGVGLGELRVTATTTTDRELIKSFEIDSHSQEAFVELDFGGSSRLYGTVHWPAGSIPSGKVRVVPKQAGKISGWCVIGPDGKFEIRGLNDAEYTVSTMQRVETRVTTYQSSIFTSTLENVDQIDVVVKGETMLDIRPSHPSRSN